MNIGQKTQKYLEKAWYIPLKPGEKYASKWGGWEQSFEENPDVYTYDETQESEKDRWGIVGTRRENFSLLIFDLDLYKADEEEQNAMKKYVEDELAEFLPVFKSETKLSYHIPFYVPKSLDLKLSDADFKEYIETCGDVISQRLAVAPYSHYDSTKKAINDKKPNIVSSKQDIPPVFFAPEEKQEKSVSKCDFDPNKVGEIEKIDDENTPPCVQLMIQRLEKGGLHGSKGHQARLFLTWTLLQSGWSGEEVYKLFKKHQPDDKFDEEKTKTPINHWLNRPKENKYFPHKCEKVKKWNLCPGCERNYVLGKAEKEESFDAPNITKDSNYEEARNAVNSLTQEVMSQGEMIINNATPAAGKTYSSLEIGGQRDETLAYFAPTHELIEEKIEEFLDLFAETHDRTPKIKHFEGATRICPSINGDLDYTTDDGMTQKDIKTLYKMGVGAVRLHNKFDLPCGDDCPWKQQFEEDYSDYDALFAPKEYIYKAELISGKNVVLDEANHKSFIKEYSFGDKTGSNFENEIIHSDDNTFLTDMIETDTSVEEMNVKKAKIYRKNPNDFDEVIERDGEKIGVKEVELEVKGEKVKGEQTESLESLEVEEKWTGKEWLEFCIKKKINPKLPIFEHVKRNGEKLYEDCNEPTLYRLETTNIDNDDKQQETLDESKKYQKWQKIIKESSKTVYIADIENKKLYINKKPPLHWSHSAQALDATADETLWQTYVHPSLKLVDLNKAVLNEIGLIVKQYTDNMNYGNSKHHDLENREKVINFLEEKENVGIISTKKTEKTIKNKNIGNKQRHAHYGNLRGSNKLRDVDEIAILDAPHTGHSHIYLMSAIAGEEAEASGRGDSLRYGREDSIGEKIFKQIREKEILQAIHRARPFIKERVVVHAFTGALPESLPVHYKEYEEKGPNARQMIERALKKFKAATTKKLKKVTNYSMQHIRRVCKDAENIKTFSSSDSRHIWRITDARDNDYNYYLDVLNDLDFFKTRKKFGKKEVKMPDEGSQIKLDEVFQGKIVDNNREKVVNSAQ